MAKGRNSIIISGIFAALVAGLLITVSTADAGAGLPPPGPFNAGDFACYSAPLAFSPGSVILDDQFFEPQQHKVVSLLGFCASGDKTIPDPDGGPGDVLIFNSPFGFGHHMMRWVIDGPSPDVGVELTDQFGITKHNVLEAREIITPASKKSGGTTFDPLLDVHWKCYGIDGDDIFLPVTFDDQFGTLTFTELKPDLLCAPATKFIDPDDPVGFPPAEDVHLKCYDVDQTTVFIDSRFNDQFLDLALIPIEFAESEKLCTTVIKTVILKPCVKFTVKGQVIPGSEQCNLEATDVWVKFRGPATIQFTRDGIEIDDPISKPKGTNDFHMEWDPATCEFLDPPGLVWTKNGVPVGTPTTIPANSDGLPANDFWFEAKKIAQVMWSFPDGTMADVPIPKGHVTDVHFECEFPG